MSSQNHYKIRSGLRPSVSHKGAVPNCHSVQNDHTAIGGVEQLATRRKPTGMKSLLAREQRELLAQVAFARVLLSFDFDGTLAPIVKRPSEAKLRLPTASLFERLCVLYPCAVISGRTQPDVTRRLGSANVKYVVGNHGLEPGVLLGDFEREMALAKRVLEPLLAAVSGLELEDKRYSLALHYRRVRRKQAARTAIQNAVAALPTAMRVVHGKQVVNVVPARAPNKGDALLDLRTLEGADLALYVGDDVSDEDVFRLDQPGRLIAVRVGKSLSSQAAYYLRSQKAMDGLFKHLIRLRQSQ